MALYGSLVRSGCFVGSTFFTSVLTLFVVGLPCTLKLFRGGPTFSLVCPGCVTVGLL